VNVEEVENISYVINTQYLVSKANDFRGALTI